ncbi:hypothetical protein TVAG_054640 [Trichomonas vaginalis G3]|uniref:Uncharacterized protein n=1 Tax=Trichomonas vaginalis (strain ATCC PRA-98 / G3) TaxID=412133 RepID=A2G4I1_TRIV3|nr:phospholipid-translocating ATPase protein [Trichomonas vaginalis G3]EAX87931.1 hypothetical protein TVAG_054640 [Trichomonas vaginalis G3]KAI5538350.1 phospholipid-translocating ATPase protein [Trichomonas vaginalis G3]|eukprot:XP_001300861.1 hypothetical protein [Trichomonas vaginalis G3]
MVLVHFDPEVKEEPKDQVLQTNITDSNNLNITELAISFITFFFSRIAFWFYFGIFIVQTCIQTPLYPTTTIIPLIFTFSSSIGIYILQSYRKRKLNYITDKKKVRVRRNHQWVEILQGNIKPGDVILLKNGDTAPCDVVLLATGKKFQIAVNTRIIDGKNQLRAKKPIQKCDHFQPENILNTDFQINYARTSEGNLPPLTERVQFDGTVIVGQEQLNISNEQFIEKFSIVYHTDEIIVAAVYTGSDCRCSLHSKTGYFRSTLLEKQLNRQNMIQIAFIFILSMVLATVSIFYRDISSSWPVLDDTPNWQYYTYSFTNFLVLLTPLSPFELYLMIDISLFIHSFFLKTAILSSVNRLDELTHIDSVVASKSLLIGTLPPTIKRIYVAGRMYGRSMTSQELSETGIQGSSNDEFDDPSFFENANTPEVSLFLEHISLCHQATVQIEKDFISFISSVPAEEPLLRLASKSGVTFAHRGPNQLIYLKGNLIRNTLLATGFIQVPNFEDTYVGQVTYIPQSKQHPRISVIIRGKGTGFIFTRWSVEEDPDLEGLPLHELKEMQSQGLQVTVLSYKQISPESLSISGSDIIQKFSEIERTGTFLALVGFEDPPRDGVLSFVNKVRGSGIQMILASHGPIRTLTTHALSLGILKKNQGTSPLRGNTQLEIDGELERMLSNLGGFDDALLMSGNQIQNIIQSKVKNVPQILKAFTVILIDKCQPNDVQLLVEYIRKQGEMTIIGIGQSITDSGFMNASSMSITVSDDSPTPMGIISDLTVDRFDQLSDIIFVTCQWLYDRITTMINFTIPRDTFLGLVQMAYQFQVAFSGTPLFTAAHILSVLVFTGCPAVSRSVLNKRVGEYILKNTPQKYYLRRRKQPRLSFIRFMISSVLCILGAIFSVWFKALVDRDVRKPYNDTISLQQFRYSMSATFILSCVAWTATQTDTWTLYHNISLFGSLICFFVGYSLVTDNQGNSQTSGVSSTMSGNWISSLSTFIFPICSIFLQFSYTLFKRFFEQEKQVKAQQPQLDNSPQAAIV